MKKFYLIFLPIFFLFFSCATLDIGEFYEPFISTENIPASCRLGKQKPKILASNDIDNDVLAFRADKYYRIMGCSIFEANKYEDDEISEAIEEIANKLKPLSQGRELKLIERIIEWMDEYEAPLAGA